MKRSFLDIRLWHKDYKMPTSKKAIKAIQNKTKKALIAEFVKSFHLTKAKVAANSIIAKDSTWFYDYCFANGTTLVLFAKWPVGIAIVNTSDYSYHYEVTNKQLKGFNASELKWYMSNKACNKYALLVTAHEAFIKCYKNENKNKPDFKQWKFCATKNSLYYINAKKEKYIVFIGTSEPQYTFCSCYKD